MEAELIRGEGRLLAPLRPSTRAYAWGSRHLLAGLTGRAAPTPGPEAEWWFGAHPRGSSVVVRAGGAMPLDEVLRSDPGGELGSADGPGRLPFLVKLLAAGRPLSIQVHPDDAAARRGFAREQAEGLPIDDPRRAFPDPVGKPEAIAALTPLTALVGLRPAVETRELIAALLPVASGPDAVPDALRGVATAWADLGRRGDAAIPALVRSVLDVPPRDLAAVIAELLPGADRVVSSGGPWAEDAARVAALGVGRVDDLGVVMAALLVPVVLAPGEVLVVPPGTIHAYLEGLGLEVMAASDDVLRAGLTDKHVDVPRLLEVATLDPSPPLRSVPRPDGAWAAVDVGAGIRLARAEVRPDGAVVTSEARPAVLVATAGTLEVATDDDRVRLPAGTDAFVSARARQVRVSGEGVVHRADVPGTRP